MNKAEGAEAVKNGTMNGVEVRQAEKLEDLPALNCTGVVQVALFTTAEGEEFIIPGLWETPEEKSADGAAASRRRRIEAGLIASIMGLELKWIDKPYDPVAGYIDIASAVQAELAHPAFQGGKVTVLIVGGTRFEQIGRATAGEECAGKADETSPWAKAEGGE